MAFNSLWFPHQVGDDNGGWMPNRLGMTMLSLSSSDLIRRSMTFNSLWMPDRVGHDSGRLDARLAGHDSKAKQISTRQGITAKKHKYLLLFNANHHTMILWKI